MAEERPGWSARAAFYCAAVGSAVGLGNIWRFPNLCFTYGGGAFLLPFILGLVFVGIPILTLEFGLGQVFRSGDVKSFSSINRRLGGVGVGSILCGFLVTTYYVIILAWAAVYFIHSFKTSEGEDGKKQFIWTASDGGAEGFLFGKVIQIADLTNEDGSFNRSTTIVHDTYWAVSILWAMIFLCIFKGPKMTGRITYLTMGVPFFLLVIFAILFGTQEGSSDGVADYLSTNFTKIAGEDLCGGRPCRDAWPDAVGQVFFSLSITFGVMTAYSSYNPKNQGIQMNAVVVCMSDFLVSLIAGFTVFTAVGFLAHKTNTPSEQVAGSAAGFGLVFLTYPAAIEGLGDSMEGKMVLAVMWFATLVLLGVDSAFSLVEGFVTSLKDSRMFKTWTRESMTFVVCIVGYLISLEYATDTGLYSLDAVDFYINVSMLFVGFMETFSAGWLWDYESHIARIGAPAWWTTLGSTFLAVYYGPRVGLGYGGPEGAAIGVVFGFAIFAAGMVVAGMQAIAHQKQAPTEATEFRGSLYYQILFSNVEDLRSKLNDEAGAKVGNFSIPFIWSVLIKFLIPPILVLFLLMKFTSSSFGAYEGYPTWYQGWGIFVGALPWLATGINFLFPNVWDMLLPDEQEVKGKPQVDQVDI